MLGFLSGFLLVLVLNRILSKIPYYTSLLKFSLHQRMLAGRKPGRERGGGEQVGLTPQLTVGLTLTFLITF